LAFISITNSLSVGTILRTPLSSATVIESATSAMAPFGEMSRLVGGPTIEFSSGSETTIFGASGFARSTISTASSPVGLTIGLPCASVPGFSSSPTIMKGAARTADVTARPHNSASPDDRARIGARRRDVEDGIVSLPGCLFSRSSMVRPGYGRKRTARRVEGECRLEDRAYRHMHEVFLNVFDTRRILGGDADRLALLQRLVVGIPKMHDIVPHHDFSSLDFGPWLVSQLREQRVADGEIIGSRNAPRRALRRYHGTHEIGPADDANELAVANDRHPPDPFAVQQVGDFSEARGVGDRDDIAGHDVRHGAPMRLQVIARHVVVRYQRIEPSRAPSLRPAFRSGFGAVQKIALADNSNQGVAGVHDGHAADAVFAQ